MYISYLYFLKNATHFLWEIQRSEDQLVDNLPGFAECPIQMKHMLFELNLNTLIGIKIKIAKGLFQFFAIVAPYKD